MRVKVILTLGLVAAACFTLLGVNTAHADSPSANQATVDITIHDSGEVSVGGINLSAFGVRPLDSQIANIAKNLGTAHMVIDNQNVIVDVQGTEVARLAWSPASRQTAAALAARYGVQIQPEVQARLEEWITSSNVDVTARFTNEVSRPLSVTLTKPLWVDISPSGQLTVEKMPLAAAIAPSALQTMQQGGSQATACWNKGTLVAKVDGAELPTLTLNPDGVSLVTKALNVPIDSGATSEVLGSTLGVDLALPGGSHVTSATCGTTP